jgi:hypothetical protein
MISRTIQDARPAGISGIKKRDYLKDKIPELAPNSKKNYVRNTCI